MESRYQAGASLMPPLGGIAVPVIKFKSINCKKMLHVETNNNLVFLLRPRGSKISLILSKKIGYQGNCCILSIDIMWHC